MQGNRTQSQFNSNFSSRISPMRATGYETNFMNKQPQYIANNYVNSSSKQIMRNMSPSPESKQMLNEKLSTNQSKRRMQALNNNNSYNRIIEKPPKDGYAPQAQNISQNISQIYGRASSVNRYSQRQKYGTNKPNQNSSNLNLKDDNLAQYQESMLKKSSSFKVGNNSTKAAPNMLNQVNMNCNNSKVLDNSFSQHNNSFNMNQNAPNNVSNALNELLNQSCTNSYNNCQNNSNYSSDRRLQQRRKASASNHQTSFALQENQINASYYQQSASAYNSGQQSTTSQYNSGVPSKGQSYNLASSLTNQNNFQYNTNNNSSAKNQTQFNYDMNHPETNKIEGLIPGSFVTNKSDNQQIDRQQRINALQNYVKNVNQLVQDENIPGNSLLKEANISTTSQQNHNDLDKLFINQYSKQDNNPYRKKLYNNMSNTSFNKSNNSNQPFKVLQNYQNMSTEINLNPQSINIKPSSTNNNQNKNQEISHVLQEYDVNTKQLQQQYTNQSTNYSTVLKTTFQNTNKFNTSFNMSKDSVSMAESNTNIEEMHFYAVEFQQNCKKWLSQIEQQF
ncbi:hypothetical protein TTHERM_01084280 (macronuclear) [Tetrahymena thermophila SB210]|uniref:Uncharacterized protein n=1 Tax=Tetrahymena thermophila (strain SB210) TaxID=312017 RepID=Q22BT9_TETTS|nr:hypothetical protein TTHERM_01084280 [Tetrahymena thermophila SB210]EAR82761.1 hypothetical protein TTHERM_01084280 [Tetrahymena thermophila SB210]|eukprot:XP_001030424.1 hypothetical protein TTHERM_01084280 [Tetrahymena thermophila SB210]